MIDLLLMEAVLEALPEGAALLLVGDKDPAPPVGRGRCWAISSRAGGCGRRAHEIHPPAAESGIVQGAHQVIQGRMPAFRQGGLADCFGIRVKDADDAAAKLVELVRKRIPERFGLDPLNDIQVLTPVNRGEVGTQELNRRLQASEPLAPAADERAARVSARRQGEADRNDHAREVSTSISHQSRHRQGDDALDVRFEDRA
jgi:exodeoxyribonuclease V alpha subunit